MQECSWQVWLPVGFECQTGGALRRTIFKAQTVKTDHPRELRDLRLKSISWGLREGPESAAFHRTLRFTLCLAPFQVFALIGFLFSASDNDAYFDKIP